VEALANPWVYPGWENILTIVSEISTFIFTIFWGLCRFLSFLRSARLFQKSATPTNRPKLWLLRSCLRNSPPKGARESSKPNDLNRTQSPPQRLRGRRQRRARGNIEKRAWQSRGVAVAKWRKESFDLPRSSPLRLRGDKMVRSERPRAGER